MPSLATFHPVVVHFAIALAVAGVLLRVLSLSGRAAWSGPAAATLLLTVALAFAAADRSGKDAHGPVERVPGSAQAVIAHEEWGERAYRTFAVVALLELVALAFRRRGWAKPVLLASALVGVGGLYPLYQAGARGGELVYSYAGGVGIRSGAPEDVGRLLLAGLHHQAQLDRKAQRPQDAAALIELAARRFPADPGVQLAAAESLLLDRQDAAAATAALQALSVPADDRRLRMRRGFLLADALERGGDRQAAISTLEQLSAELPGNARLEKRLDELRAAR